MNALQQNEYTKGGATSVRVRANLAIKCLECSNL